MIRIGPFEVHAVLAGEFRLDGGAMFGVVPKVLWERTNPADGKNLILMALRCLLVRGNGKLILVDTGIGKKLSEKQNSMFGVDHSRYNLVDSLEALGVSLSEITDVVITHLHFDHVGGATVFGDENKIELAFPNANYYVQKKNFGHAHAPTERDRASFFSNTIDPLVESGRLKIIDGEFEWAPGVSAWITHGHTPGQQLVKVTDANKTLLFCADTIPTSSHIPLPYVMSFDLEPLVTIEEKKLILSRAVKENWILCFDHDPVVSACTVAFRDGRYSILETLKM